jgi:lysophospholipase L1-like esterase
VALGDSLTFGYRIRDPYAVDPRVPYPAQLEALLRGKNKQRQVFVINMGVNGDTTDGMIARFERMVTSEKPDVVIVLGGINDLVAARLPEQVIANLMKLYAMCEGIGAKSVACTVTPTRNTSPKIRRLNDLIRVHASEKGLILAACARGNLKQKYSDDGAHLTIDGYHKIAEVVFKAIEKMKP